MAFDVGQHYLIHNRHLRTRKIGKVGDLGNEKRRLNYGSKGRYGARKSRIIYKRKGTVRGVLEGKKKHIPGFKSRVIRLGKSVLEELVECGKLQRLRS